MKVVFRCDASLDIGTGHVMRCLTFALELKQQGADCEFVCRAHPGNLAALIESRGFPLHVLPVGKAAHGRLAHSHWLGASQRQDAEDMHSILQCAIADWIVVDHYALDEEWETAVRPYCRHIMAIDDLADRKHDCDLLLDQNAGRSVEDYRPLTGSGCHVFCGPEYSLLRSEFRLWRERSLSRRTHTALSDVLVSLGGVDRDDITSSVIRALSLLPFASQLNVTVVMGHSAPHLSSVNRRAGSFPGQCHVLSGVDNMAELLSSCDLVIGAAGSSAWERCSLGVPTIMCVLADNQKIIAESLGRAGAALVVSQEALDEQLPQMLRDMFNQPSILADMSHRAAAVTDGEGVVRIAAALGEWGYV